jgi:hypothetical protein
VNEERDSVHWHCAPSTVSRKKKNEPTARW